MAVEKILHHPAFSFADSHFQVGQSWENECKKVSFCGTTHIVWVQRDFLEHSLVNDPVWSLKLE
jgi:hypothetical protein